MVRGVYKRLYLKVLERRAYRPSARQMESSAVVFSPHYDDETLGVGGTIIKKRRCGAAVYLVFMTDGSKSHAHAMDGTRLSALRRDEALHAAHVLGVDESHVIFLEYPETHLQQHAIQAVQRVSEILWHLRCQQVFVPSTCEPALWSADHKATTDVVFRALINTRDKPEIYGYGVWFWYHWPWVPILRSNDTRRLLTLSRRALFGLSASMNFNTAIYIADVLSEKRLALEKYKSQMTRLAQDKPWPVLGDLAHGEFLKLFFRSNEFFNSYHFPAGVILHT